MILLSPIISTFVFVKSTVGNEVQLGEVINQEIDKNQ